MSFNKDIFKNNKFKVGNIAEQDDYKGWFIGRFFPEDHPAHTEAVEVMYREHTESQKIVAHYHEHKVEILILLEGRAKYTINGKEYNLEKGDYYFADVNNVIEGEFLEDSKVIVIHSPSIPEDKIDTIFEEFTQVDSSSTRAIGGTGLGLSITKHFVDMHGGRIWVNSVIDQGSTFYIALPIAGPPE